MSNLPIPLIDIGRYTNPTSPEDKAEVLANLDSACRNLGFFQLTGHGIPLSAQKDALDAAKRLFALPQEQKDAMSLKKSASRKGYEALSQQTMNNYSLPDMKEGFYIGRDDETELKFLRGPNVWPDLPDAAFRRPLMSYWEYTRQLGETIWEMIVVALGYQVKILDNLKIHPFLTVKPIRYPKHVSVDARQWGAGAHRDFGGITMLFQEPGKPGLEVQTVNDADQEQWIPVPAVEDVLVVNLGDMIQEWTGGRYHSILHRVMNRNEGDRYSIPAFYQGNLDATNPMDAQGTESVSQFIARKFEKSFGLESKSL